MPSGQVQAPCTQTDPLPQVRLQAPQLELSVCRFTHDAPQMVVPLGQVHVPPWQVAPPLQLVLQLPHAALSVRVLRHVPLQSVVPAGHWQVQVAELNCLPPLQVALTHPPLQTICPAGQVAHFLLLGVVPAQ